MQSLHHYLGPQPPHKIRKHGLSSPRFTVEPTIVDTTQRRCHRRVLRAACPGICTSTVRRRRCRSFIRAACRRSTVANCSIAPVIMLKITRHMARASTNTYINIAVNINTIIMIWVFVSFCVLMFLVGITSTTHITMLTTCPSTSTMTTRIMIIFARITSAKILFLIQSRNKQRR